MEHEAFNHTAHKALWDWLARNPTAEKREWPMWSMYDDAYTWSRCFACKYALGAAGLCHCEHCPLQWPITDSALDAEDEDPCTSYLYMAWFNANTAIERTNLALRIRDLPICSHVQDVV